MLKSFNNCLDKHWDENLPDGTDNRWYRQVVGTDNRCSASQIQDEQCGLAFCLKLLFLLLFGTNRMKEEKRKNGQKTKIE